MCPAQTYSVFAVAAAAADSPVAGADWYTHGCHSRGTPCVHTVTEAEVRLMLIVPHLAHAFKVLLLKSLEQGIQDIIYSQVLAQL